MKKLFLIGVLLTISMSVFANDVDKPKKRFIKTAPSSPVITGTMRRAELSARRQNAAKLMKDNSIMILFSAKSKLYANDVDYHYRQENNLYYLTGLKKNGATLVMQKVGGEVSEAIFIPKRNPRSETWNGKMYSNEEATAISGISTVVDAKMTKDMLSAVAAGTSFASDGFSTSKYSTVYLQTGKDSREYGQENDFEKRVKSGVVDNARPIFTQLRIIKSPYEQKLLQHAVDITSEALGRSMGMIGRAKFEYEVQAEVEYTFRRRNADFWGYPSIVGCGPNATTLHYIESQGAVNKGDLMLMDVGAEYDHYTADVTRTFPVNGKFTKEQAEIYQIVYDAQEAAAATLKPGAKFGDPAVAARDKIEEGLLKLGLITKKGESRVWYMHGWGHWLGMNVHDVGGGRNTVLKPGMVMTNEPGIYIRADALDNLPDNERWNEFRRKVQPVFEKYKNIGVRIEDDMLITEKGAEWMSKALPRTIADVEAFMVGAKTEMDRYALIPSLHKYPATPVTGINFSEVLAFDQGKTVRYGVDRRGAHRHSH